MADGHGGARLGAGRKPKRTEAQLIEALASTLVEMAIGQSNVSLELDSKNSIKPHVSVFGNDVGTAGKRAEAEFDRLLEKYHPKAPVSAPAALDEFSESDLKLLGLQRIAAKP